MQRKEPDLAMPASPGCLNLFPELVGRLTQNRHLATRREMERGRREMLFLKPYKCSQLTVAWPGPLDRCLG